MVLGVISPNRVVDVGAEMTAFVDLVATKNAGDDWCCCGTKADTGPRKARKMASENFIVV